MRVRPSVCLPGKVSRSLHKSSFPAKGHSFRRVVTALTEGIGKHPDLLAQPSLQLFPGFLNLLPLLSHRQGRQWGMRDCMGADVSPFTPAKPTKFIYGHMAAAVPPFFFLQRQLKT